MFEASIKKSCRRSAKQNLEMKLYQERKVDCTWNGRVLIFLSIAAINS